MFVFVYRHTISPLTLTLTLSFSLSLSLSLCVQTTALQHAEEERARVQEDLKRQLESLRLDASSQETLNARLQEQLQQVRDTLRQPSHNLQCV